MGSVDTVHPSTTEQIMARYRPIAPKPPLYQSPAAHVHPHNFQSHSIPTKPACFPTKTGGRKKARVQSSVMPAPRNNRYEIRVPQMTQVMTTASLHGHGLGFQHYRHFMEEGAELVSLPNLACMSSAGSPSDADDSKLLAPPFLEEKIAIAEFDFGRVINPQPVRAVSSRITIGCITDQIRVRDSILKRPEEVEHQVEMESLPVVVSDSKNKVRLTNSAYKELIGQPECAWLDSVVSSRRLDGEVTLSIPTLCKLSPISRFSCMAKIDWCAYNGSKFFIVAPCNVTRTHCEDRRYLFAWRFNFTQNKSRNKVS